jgi:hypothetical protein
MSGGALHAANLPRGAWSAFMKRRITIAAVTMPIVGATSPFF